MLAQAGTAAAACCKLLRWSSLSNLETIAEEIFYVRTVVPAVAVFQDSCLLMQSSHFVHNANARACSSRTRARHSLMSLSQCGSTDRAVRTCARLRAAVRVALAYYILMVPSRRVRLYATVRLDQLNADQGRVDQVNSTVTTSRTLVPVQDRQDRQLQHHRSVPM